jgi:hypothetical protein
MYLPLTCAALVVFITGHPDLLARVDAHLGVGPWYPLVEVTMVYEVLVHGVNSPVLTRCGRGDCQSRFFPLPRGIRTVCCSCKNAIITKIGFIM